MTTTRRIFTDEFKQEAVALLASNGVLCDALNVSPSGYYAWRTRPGSPWKAANRRLLGDIRRLHEAHRQRYRVPRIHAALRAEGHIASRGRVERLAS